MNQENYRIWFEGSKGETRANIFFHEFEGERNEQRQQQREEIDRILPNSDWAAFIFLVAILASAFDNPAVEYRTNEETQS